jgi:hypothetical protein
MTESAENITVNAENKPSVVFMVGRANPPTPGHIRIMEEVLRLAYENGAQPRIYLSMSGNMLKAKKNITHVTNDCKDSNLRKEPCYSYVKHKNYENPLDPRRKKQFVIDMLHHRGERNLNYASNFNLDEVVVTDFHCNGTFRAFGCVKDLEPNPERIIYVLGEEVDPNEREQREINCLHVAREHEHKFHCHSLPREGNDPIVTMSGSKVRLIVASRESIDDETTAKELFHEVYNDYLPKERIDELFAAIKDGILNPVSTTNNITKKRNTPNTSYTQTQKRQHYGGIRRKTKRIKKPLKKQKTLRRQHHRRKKYFSK